MNRTDIEEAVDNYYKLKGAYDEKYNNAKHEISKSDASKEEKRRKIKMIKRACVRCQKGSGSIFTNKNRVLKAICGSKTGPCDLNIEIKTSKYMLLNKALELTTRDIEDNKADIIDMKLELLFGLITEEEIVNEFERLKNEYKDNNKRAAQIMGALKAADEISILDPITREKRYLTSKQYLKLMGAELADLIMTFKQLIKEYMEEDETNARINLLKRATNIYIDDIVPLMNKTQRKTYAVTMVEKENDLFVLKQLRVLPEYMEFESEIGEIIFNA